MATRWPRAIATKDQQRPPRGRSGPIRRPGSGFRRICSRGRNVQTHVLGSGTTREQAPSSGRYFRFSRTSGNDAAFPAGQATAPGAASPTPLQRRRPTNPARIAPKGVPSRSQVECALLQFFKNDAKFLVPQHGVFSPLFFSSASASNNRSACLHSGAARARQAL